MVADAQFQLPAPGQVGPVSVPVPVRVSVVSGSDLVLHGLSSMLEQHDDVVVTHAQAEVVLYDALHPVGDHADRLARLASSGARVIAVVGDDVPHWLWELVEGTTVAKIHWGASSEQLAAAVVSAASRTVGSPPTRSGVPSPPQPRRSGSETVHGVLSSREAEVLALISVGLSNAEIAERLFLSINSVKTYIRAAYRKIGVVRRSQAVVWAIHHGLADPNATRQGVVPVTGPGMEWEHAVASRGVR